MAEKKRGWMAAWTAPIRSGEDAEKTLGDIGKGWYVIGVIQALFVVLSGMPLTSGLPDVLFCVGVGYFLPARKSRTLALVAMTFAAFIAVSTVLNRLGMSDHGGRNIILGLFLLWMAYRGARATFVYHRRVGSQVRWKNVLIVLTTGIILAVGTLVIAVLILAFVGEPEPSDELYEFYGMVFIVSALMPLVLCLMFMPRWYPFTVQIKRDLSERP